MFGGSSKLGGGGRGGAGRGGGPGAKRRNSTSSSFSHPPPPLHRPPTAPRLSLGVNPRNNRSGGGGGPDNSKNATSVEESFALIPGSSPPAFAMIIRLVPDLVDEIKRVEAQGDTARIKFDSMANNPNGNVINVGGKEFRFTWSREVGDLCDIYEQRESGEDGDGLLVESGCAWRKVNVQRILDESTKNHVKMRSEEAERKHKSRKAIVLDHSNPSMKSHIKQLAAAEANPWRTGFKQKKEPPFKKQKSESPQVGGPPKSYKTGITSGVNPRGRPPSSPLPSTPEKSGILASPLGTGSSTKIHTSTEEITPNQFKDKQIAASEKGIFSGSGDSRKDAQGKGYSGAKSADIERMLISLLAENKTNGMTIKALEKAIGDSIPGTSIKIEPTLKKIATCQASGRYFLKADMENAKKPSFGSGSSSEDNRGQTLASEDDREKKPTPEHPAVGLEEHALLDPRMDEETNEMEKNILRPSPDLFGETKDSDKSEGRAGSSSDSSGSGSDSSDSGSDSGSSRSKSQSPTGGGSGSSSDSDSDASSSGKEGSDEDVDIMTSDDREPQEKFQASEPGFSSSPDPWRSLHNGEEKQDGEGSGAVDIEGDGSGAVDVEGDGSGAVDIEGDGSDAVDIDGNESDAVDIDKNLADEGKVNVVSAKDNLLPDEEGEMFREDVTSMLADPGILQDREAFIGTLFDDGENILKDGNGQEHSDSSERTSKGKSKKGSDRKKHLDEKSERRKRRKSDNLTRATNSGSWNALDRRVEDMYEGPGIEGAHKNRGGGMEFDPLKGHNETTSGKTSSELPPVERTSDQSKWVKTSETAGKSRQTENAGHTRKPTDKSSLVQETFPVQQKEKPLRGGQHENSLPKEKKVPKRPKDGRTGGRQSTSFDSNNWQQAEMSGKSKDALQAEISSPKDVSIGVSGKHTVAGTNTLQREPSDLELGELREPLLEETPTDKRFDRKGSFKKIDGRPSTSDSHDKDLSKGRPVGKVALDLGRPSPCNQTSGIRRNQDQHSEDTTKPVQKFGQSRPQNLLRAENAEVGPQFNKLAVGAKVPNGIEGYGENQKKAPTVATQMHDVKRGQPAHSIKETKARKSNNTMAGKADVRKDNILSKDNNGAAQKKRESSPEEDSSSFYKYEKDAPELKGPIRDFTQYKEYVQEFRDKHESYDALNKILEGYRTQFLKLGKDLELAKGRDMDRYQTIVVQLQETFRQCEAKNKRFKKIFIVLHEELKNLKQRIIDFGSPYTKD